MQLDADSSRNNSSSGTSNAQTLQTPPPATLPVDKANRIAKLLNSAMKEENKSKKPQKSSVHIKELETRVKELETRLATCLKEYKKYKEECFMLKAERESYIEEIKSLTSLNIELQDTLEVVNDQLLNQEAYSEAASEEREIRELSQAKSIAILEKENLLLESELDDVKHASTETLSDLASVKMKVADQEKQLAAQQEKSESLETLKKSLRDAQHICEQMQIEMKRKDSEIEELLEMNTQIEEYMNKLQELQVIEKEKSTSTVEAVQEENRELRIEVSTLTDSLQSQDNVVASLEEKKVECGELQVVNSDLRVEVSRLNESILSLETDKTSVQEKQVACEQLASERDDLKESLKLFEEDESSVILEYKENNLKLQNELKDVKLNFEVFKEDTAATIKDKQTEALNLSKNMHELQEAVQNNKETEIALYEKKIEIEKLLKAVETFREALACGRQEVKQLNEALTTAKTALAEAEAKAKAQTQSSDNEQVSQKQSSDEVESTDTAHEFKRALEEVEALKQGNSDLESITAEKSLEAMDLKEKAELLREELVREKENAQSFIKDLQSSLSARDNQIKDMKNHHKTEITAGKKSLEATEKELEKLKKTAQASSEGETSGLSKRMQVLKTQKESTQHRAEVAEGKLLVVSRQLTEITRAHELLEKEKVVLGKQIHRLELAATRSGSSTSISGGSGDSVVGVEGSGNHSQNSHSGSAVKRAKNKKGGGTSLSMCNENNTTTDGSPDKQSSSSTIARDMTVSLVIAVTFLYLGTLLSNPSSST